jgi:hypothetical protein
LVHVLFLNGLMGAPQLGPAQDTATFTLAIRIDVTDTVAVVERPLGPRLLLRVTRAWAGWIVSVVRRPARQDSPNLLYHSRSWHGPYITDVLAWLHAQQRMPDERILPVYRYPYEIRIRLIDARTLGTGEDAHFTGGTLEVAWRRAKPVAPP